MPKKSKRMKKLIESGLIGCLNDSGITSENYKQEIAMKDDKDNYTIEKLIEEFAKHHEEVVKKNKELHRKIANGEVEFQEWMKDSFSLPLALQIICKEIKALKEK